MSDWKENVERVREALPDHLPECSHRECQSECHWPALDALTTQIKELEHDAIDVEADRRYQQDRARAAEQRVEELERERDEAQIRAGHWRQRAEKAERALAEMRKALGAYRGALLSGKRETPKLAALADAALAASTEEPR